MHSNIFSPIDSCIKKPIMKLWQLSASLLSSSGIGSPVTPPSISGINVIALWTASYSTPTKIIDVVGDYDLDLVAGTPSFVNNTPNGSRAIYFDGTVEFTAPTLPQGATGICMFIRPEDSVGIGKDYCGFGNGAGNFLSLYYDSDSNSGVRRDGSSLGTALGPVMQWFVPLVSQSSGFTQVFNNTNGGSASGSSTTRTGFSLGGRYPGGGTSNRFKGWFYGAFIFDTPVAGYPSTAQMDEMGRYWFGKGAMPTATAGQKLLIVSGDSISCGTGLTNAQSIPTLLRNSLTGFKVASVGCPGIATGSCIARDPYFVDPFYSATRERNVVVLVGEPTNEIAGGASGATAVASVTSWSTTRMTAGFESIICTCLDRTGFTVGMNTAKAAYNTTLRANFNVATSSPYVFLPATGITYATAMVDVHAIPGVTTLDGVHPDAAGAALMAEQIRIAIEATATTADPVMDPETGTFSGTEEVTITCATSGASIYYTLDGPTPDATDTLYTGPIELTETTTVKAIAIRSGYANSSVVSETYTYSSVSIVSLDWQTTSGTVVGNLVTLPDGGFANSSLTIDSTIDFSIVCDCTTATNYLSVAIDSAINEVAWGGGDAYYSGFIFVGDALYRLYSNGTNETLSFTATMPSKVRLRKSGDDLLIETSPDGTTWTTRDTRAGILSGVTTVRVKAVALYASSVSAVLEQ